MSADTIPQKYLDAANDVARYLSMARAIERKQYPEGGAPGELLPALLLSLSVRHGADEIVRAIDDMPNGIESELFKIAGRLAVRTS